MRYEYQGYTPKWGWMVSYENLTKMDQEGKLHWNSKDDQTEGSSWMNIKANQLDNLWTDIKVNNPMSQERLNFDG